MFQSGCWFIKFQELIYIVPGVLLYNFFNWRPIKEWSYLICTSNSSVFAKISIRHTWFFFFLPTQTPIYTHCEHTHTCSRISQKQSWYVEIILRPSTFQLTKINTCTNTHTRKSRLEICIRIICKEFKVFDWTIDQWSSVCVSEVIRELIFIVSLIT